MRRLRKSKMCNMQNNKNRYDPIGAVRYHFTQFNVWTAFFIVINGGLLVAYGELAKLNSAFCCSDFSTKKLLIPLLGYIVAFLCFCLCVCYKRCIKKLSTLIEKDFKINNPRYIEFCSPLGQTKILTTIIVMLLAFALTCAWGTLFVLNLFEKMENLYLLCKAIAGAFVTAFLLFLADKYLQYYFNKIANPELKQSA
ncbi:MAG: hypothetical protein FWE23_00055 [Chitinivibrionia bacterium]|nr:hypothetical protein [Chitinivibrionia bacterium]